MKKLLSLLFLSWLAISSGHGQAISPYLAGQNAWLPTALGTQVYNGQLDRLWPLVKQSKVKMIRIGGNGVNSNLVTNAQYIALIDSIRRIGAEPMVQVSEGRGRFTAAQAAQVVQHVNITMGRNIKYWIIGNEPDLNNTSQPNPVSVAGVETYIKSFASAMKAVDPTILTVGPENASYNGYFSALVGGANDITGQDANGRYYIDVISFHTYPFNGTQTRAGVVSGTNNLTTNVNNLLGLMAAANTKNNRTGANALRWALTEFNVDYANPTANTVEGVGVHSFLNGQFWAEVFGVGMKYGAVSMLPWSIHEGSGARGTGDLGYIDGGTPATFKPRSAFWHEMLVSENLHGTNLNATDNQALVKVLSSTDNGTTAVMLLNESDVTDYNFTVQLDGSTVPGTAALKINVPAGINAAYNDKIYAQSTLVLLFNAQGTLTRKIVYSLQHAQQALPPTYRNPGYNVTLADFSSDKTFSCVAPEAVNFTASVLGEATSLTWDFGAGATPATGSGRGPIAVTYATAGNKTISLTLVNADTTITTTKANYLPVSTCIRTPYPSPTPVIPGLVKAIEYDNGGENVAYHDTEVANRGAAADPNVPRPTEGVDTSNSGEGIGEVGYTASGEWLKYTVNVLRTGLYQLRVRVSTGATSTGSVRLSVNDVDRTGAVAVPATGSFGTYQDLVINNVYLEASPNATLKFDIVSGGFNFSKLTFAEQPLTGIVVNRLYNGSSTSDGSTDAVELLVVQDHLDIRGLIMKDFETNLTSDTGGKYQFKDVALWKDLRVGTTIVLRRLTSGISGYVEDTDPSDFKIDLLMENATYLDALAPSGQNFNLTQTDMVLLKTGTASGTDNPVHAFATNATGLAFYTAVTSPKLLASNLGTGFMAYPTNPAQSTADYNGSNAATSSSTSRNWGDGFGTPNIAYIQSLRGQAVTPPTIVVNRIYNGSNDGTGNLDAVELLVVQDHLDVRGMIVKDFESNGTADTGGKYQFTNNAFWSDLRSGTTIVLRQLAGPAGYAPDYDASDFTLDFLLGNTTYLTNVGGTNIFNITQYDMVMVKAAGSPAAGVTGAIHTFATHLALGGSVAAGTTANYTATPNYKMAAPDLDNGGSPSKFVYPLNPTQTLADYNGTGKANSSGSTALNWGYGFGTPNVTYIQSLRNAVTGPDLVVANGQNMPAGGAYNSITVQNGGTLTPQLPTTTATTVRVLTGGKLISNCQTLSGTGSFELQAGAELQICDPAGIAATGATGAIQLAGPRSFSTDAVYTYNGTAPQTTGAGLPATVRGLTVNSTAPLATDRTLTLSQPVSVAQVARLQSGNLNTGGQSFTLLSSTAGTALLDNTGGVVNGAGTMQRAITSTVTGPAYRHFSSPVAGAPLSSLTTAGFTPTFNTAYNSSATPGAVAPFPTVFGYDESRLATVASNYSAFDKGWYSPTADTDVMQPTRGYTANAPASAAPVAFTGTFNNATQNSGALSRGTDADAGWQLLGNPYPAPLDWNTVTPAQRPGMDAAMYVYQSTGQYAGTYRTYANGVGASPLVVAGSGYFARVSAAGTPGAVNLTNANRVTTFGTQPAFGRGTNDIRPQLRLTLSGAGLQDDAYLYFEQGATAGVDAEFDAAKLSNPTGLNLASLTGNMPLAINALAPLGAVEVVVPLSVRVPHGGTFALEVADMSSFGSVRVYLRDALTGTQQALTTGSRYPFALDTTTAGNGRFSLAFRPAAVTATRAELTAAAVSLYPNPAHGSFTVLLPPLVGQSGVRATLLNALGQQVQARNIGLTAAGATAEFNTSNLAAGVYVLRLQADSQVLTKRVVVE
ncbi:T9SS type A sorting domain-containing protein [Hymenobacter convexus]|uniref:T9SS type A sorting domain-containing protein n=1 Tax=Hymenobacter sp. CA1UV-4 TaxID=3063782 RepID=UPI002713D14A|nr:T9SS type A sorting domain-containing protein [Hymenobacter sp. CA1UV-4]MDO7851762.1 T9SS type A sorting domain-containing protein [Hymenobacter sp. CA1UV-4]